MESSQDLDINSCNYKHLIFDKEAKIILWKKSIHNKGWWHNRISTCRRMQIDPYLFPYTKLKSRWIKILNTNTVTLNLIEEKVGSSLQCMSTGDHFLNLPSFLPLSESVLYCHYLYHNLQIKHFLHLRTNCIYYAHYSLPCVSNNL